MSVNGDLESPHVLQRRCYGRLFIKKCSNLCEKKGT